MDTAACRSTMDDRMVATFEMLVERLSALEAAVESSAAGQMAVRAHDDWLRPRSAVLSAVPYCGRPYRLQVHFDHSDLNEGPRRVAVVVDGCGARHLCEHSPHRGWAFVATDLEAELAAVLGAEEWAALKARLPACSAPKPGARDQRPRCDELGIDAPCTSLDCYLMERLLRHRHPEIAAVGMDVVLLRLDDDSRAPHRFLPRVVQLVAAYLDMLGQADAVDWVRVCEDRYPDEWCCAMVRHEPGRARAALAGLSAEDRRWLKEEARGNPDSFLYHTSAHLFYPAAE